MWEFHNVLTGHFGVHDLEAMRLYTVFCNVVVVWGQFCSSGGRSHRIGITEVLHVCMRPNNIPGGWRVVVACFNVCS